MNKLPTKQIYLLLLIITGIITLSIYSTYAIFTLESETSDILNMHTPNSLILYSNTTEYKQLIVPKNSYITTDIDLYNSFNYELCYSIWYKTINSKDASNDKIKIYENTDTILTASGLLESVGSKRVSLLITNDNNVDVKVNIGLAYKENDGTCKLNITNDKSLVTTTINNPKLLTSIKNNTEPIAKEKGYLTYKDNTDSITLLNDKKIYISKEFTEDNEVFTLNTPEEMDLNKIKDYNNYYTCLFDTSCRYLYKIKEITEEEKEDNKIYKLTKYDTLVSYLPGLSGIRKINDNYVYFGDNPNNFIYYNCLNVEDTKTCELWRIIGFYHDQEEDKYITKIIKNDYLKPSNYSNTSNLWNESNINKYLNEEYKISASYLQKEITFNEENVTDLEIKINDIKLLSKENKSKVTLMNLSDYLNASICEDKLINEYDETCLNNNWLNKNKGNEWTMSTKYLEDYLDEETNEIIKSDNSTLYAVESKITEVNINDELNIRPVVYLMPRTFLTSGDGTIDNPYMIK